MPETTSDEHAEIRQIIQDVTRIARRVSWRYRIAKYALAVALFPLLLVLGVWHWLRGER